jgi:hypothetical protein
LNESEEVPFNNHSANDISNLIETYFIVHVQSIAIKEVDNFLVVVVKS